MNWMPLAFSMADTATGHGTMQDPNMAGLTMGACVGAAILATFLRVVGRDLRYLMPW